jgi:hypothetical protein
LNYESFIERDLDGVAAAVRGYRAAHSAEDVWQAVTRFAILAYAPSLHAKHAVLSCLAAWQLRDQLGDAFDELVVECARYTAQSRQPWSEPPIFDPPHVDVSHPRDADELRAAVAAHDRLRGEQWLAARLDNRELARDLFLVAAEGVSGDPLLTAVAAWKLAALLGEKGRFVALRIAVWELTSGAATKAPGSATDIDAEALLHSLIDDYVASGGDVSAAQALFLFDAALEASAISGDDAIAQSVFARLSERVRPSGEKVEIAEPAQPPMTYPLARDYGTHLIAHAVARRIAARFASIDAARIIAAAGHNLVHGSSFEDFAFA